MVEPSPYAEELSRIRTRRVETVVLGAPTTYWEYGEPEARVTLLLVHGFRGDHHGLEPVVAKLPAGIRVVAPDLPGFGGTGVMPGREHDIDAFADWVRAFAVQLDLDGHAVVVGHSFGSIVTSAALAGGLQASRAVLINPIAAPALKGPRGILTWFAVQYYRLSALLPERMGFALLRSGLVVRVMSSTMAKTKDPSLRRWIHEEHLRYFSGFADRRSLLESFRASVSNDVSSFAASIPTTTLLIAAERDDITRVSAQHELLELFADARLEVIPEVGHLIHYETPTQAADAVAAFLGKSTEPRLGSGADEPTAQEAGEGAGTPGASGTSSPA